MKVEKLPIPLLLLVGSVTAASIAWVCLSTRVCQHRDREETRAGLGDAATQAREMSAAVASQTRMVTVRLVPAVASDQVSARKQQQATQGLGGESSSQTGVRKGMTWGKANHDPELGIDLVGCHGRPKPEGARGCDAYRGDTPCTEARPILCIKKDGSPRPPYAVSGTGHQLVREFYRGWAEGEIGLTKPVRGVELLSYENASSICAAALGPGFRMAQHHDSRWVVGMSEDEYHTQTWPTTTNTGGWNFWARGNISGESRFWVYIADQDANCWQENLAAQRAQYRKNLDEIRSNSSWHNRPDRESP